MMNTKNDVEKLKKLEMLNSLKGTLENIKDKEDETYQIDDSLIKVFLGELMDCNSEDFEIINKDTRKIIDEGISWINTIVQDDDMFIPIKDIKNDKTMMYELGKKIPVNDMIDYEDYSRCVNDVLYWLGNNYMDKLNHVNFYHLESGDFDCLIKCEFEIKNIDVFKKIAQEYYKSSIQYPLQFEKMNTFEKYDDFTYAMDEWNISRYNKRIETPYGYLYVHENRR